MEHSTSEITQASYKYFAQQWKPADVQAVVLIIHGQSDHSTRYTHVAEFFAGHNIATVGIDLYGHGNSEGKRGHVPNYEVFLDSVQAALDWVKEEYPGHEPFLYGHSMGGNIVANFALKRDASVKGYILTGPYFRLAFKPSPFQVMLAKSVVNLTPSMTQPTKLDAKGLSRDKAVVQAYKDDPLVHGMISPVEFLSLVEQGEWVMQNAKKWKDSLLLMHGSKDPITSFKASEEFFKKASGQGKDITFKAWEGQLHEIHNEIGKEEVLTLMKDWIIERA